VCIYIGKQKVVWILKLRENGWEAAASALTKRKRKKERRRKSEIYIFSNKRWSVLSGIARYISFILSLCQF
jgi:hypothetical protein